MRAEAPLILPDSARITLWNNVQLYCIHSRRSGTDTDSGERLHYLVVLPVPMCGILSAPYHSLLPNSESGGCLVNGSVTPHGHQ